MLNSAEYRDLVGYICSQNSHYYATILIKQGLHYFTVFFYYVYIPILVLGIKAHNDKQKTGHKELLLRCNDLNMYIKKCRATHNHLHVKFMLSCIYVCKECETRQEKDP